jgi:FMN phosphatase YigB (HAD superfamily)
MRPNAPRTVVFDLDDTLIATSHLFHKSLWACGMLIHDALGTRSPFPTDVLALQQEIDAMLIQENGFVKNRFTESIVRTYVRLAEQRRIRPKREIKDALRRAARPHSDGPFVMLPGAANALRAIHADGHALHLVTMGEQRLQRRKIRQTGLLHLFDSVHVTTGDKRAAIERCLGGEDPARCVMVGDSKRSDIAAAVAIGMIAVWIPGDPWPFAKADVPEDAFHQLDSVADVPAFIRSLG